MSGLQVEEKQVVVPGQVIAEGMEYLPSHGTYRKDDKVLVNKLGILSVEGKVLKTQPLSGRYIPKQDDIIIGKVIDILVSGWRFDVNSPYSAVLPVKDASFDFIARGADLSKYFALEDYAVAKVTNVTSQNLVDLTVKGQGLKKLEGGRILKANCHKVPRIIGKKGSMISLIKEQTGCNIIVGQNGWIWIKGEPKQESLAYKAINMVEKESHKQGLTEKVQKLLDKGE